MSEYYGLRPDELRTLCERWDRSFSGQIEKMAKGCLAAMNEVDRLNGLLGDMSVGKLRDRLSELEIETDRLRYLLLVYMRHLRAEKGLTYVEFMKAGPERDQLLEIEKKI